MKPTGATKKLTDWTMNEQLVNTAVHAENYKERVDARVKIIEQLNERERLREALRAALNSLSRTVRKSYPNYPEEQMQISETTTVANARTILNDTTTSTSAGGG